MMHVLFFILYTLWLVDQVESSPHFVLFFTPWSSHCRKLAPVWEELASRHNKEQERMVRDTMTIVKTIIIQYSGNNSQD